MIYTYTKKLIKCGNVWELYDYEFPIIVGGSKSTNGGRHNECVDEKEKQRHRETAIARQRKVIRRLVNTNMTERSSFLTLTFAENLIDETKAKLELKKFFMRLRYNYPELKHDYLAVWERQKRGAVHFHIILFDVPKIPLKVLNKLWGHGFVKINKIKGIDNVGAYVCKYLSKDLDSDEKKSSRRYTTSRGLKEPLIITNMNSVLDKKIAEAVGSNFDFLNYENSFETEHYGKINYKQFIIHNEKNQCL
ncbi:MAG: rolling circle replication-associated protein [Fusobacteriaceae bacterium]